MKRNNQKELVAILGMHRSATSLTGNLLWKMGLYMGKEEEWIAADKDNKNGFFEFKKLVDLNREILFEHNMFWASVSSQNFFIDTNDHCNDICNILSILLKDGKEKNIAIKDPRLCICEPNYRNALQHLGVKEKIIFVFRNPMEVARSIEKRNHINYYYALKLWFYYNIHALKAIVSMDENSVLIINHDEYFSDTQKQISKILSFLELNKSPYNFTDIIDKSLRHHYASQEAKSQLEKETMKLYNSLLELADSKIKISEINFITYEKNKQFLLETSFDDQNDLFDNAFKNCDSPEIKQLCIWILTHKKETVRNALDKWLKEHHVQHIAIYGNGTVASALYPILEDLSIDLSRIFDKQMKGSYIFREEEIPIVNITECSAEKNEFVINTIVLYEGQAEKEILEKYQQNYIFSLFTFLCCKL